MKNQMRTVILGRSLRYNNSELSSGALSAAVDFLRFPFLVRARTCSGLPVTTPRSCSHSIIVLNFC